MSAFVTADLHLGHAKSITFVDPEGQRIRPFDSLDELHDALITRWNSTVNAKDTVYVLGDVAIARQALKLLSEFNGRKILIKGNHDIFRLKDYLPYFDDIRGAMVRDNLVFTHIPIHSDSFENRYIGNVHGHLHCHTVKDSSGNCDLRYYSACVERNNFTPVSLDYIKDFFADRGRAQADV